MVILLFFYTYLTFYYKEELSLYPLGGWIDGWVDPSVYLPTYLIAYSSAHILLVSVWIHEFFFKNSVVISHYCCYFDDQIVPVSVSRSSLNLIPVYFSVFECYPPNIAGICIWPCIWPSLALDQPFLPGFLVPLRGDL